MTLGWDAAGIVEATGSDVSILKTGDAVYGVPNFPGDGSYAEYCVAKATQFALKPKSLSFNEAAGIPLAALTAWTAIFEDGKLMTGQRIFIQGAPAGVGGFAVQFAKARGAYVMGTTSTDNLELVRKIGADEVIDYTNQNFEELVHNIDIVLEASPTRNNDERIKAMGVLNEGEIFVSVNTDFPFSDQLTQAADDKKITEELSAN